MSNIMEGNGGVSTSFLLELLGICELGSWRFERPFLNSCTPSRVIGDVAGDGLCFY
ncbi:hypothetical protein WN55_11280 [Dufourea novaeangliae]|uniref:Uncharacterized protein n=1 Tax=Dufourea novaeangliae TaxID=178035 RepID=A0A154PBY4_DUFNO|nr:hypothetical protein WN55_11280 [Dufourea novaeangliae]